MPPSVLIAHQRHWTVFGLCAAGFGVLMLLISVNGGDLDTEDRLLKLRFEAAVSEAVKSTQRRISEHDRLLDGLALHFNYLGEDSGKRFRSLLRERHLPEAFPAILRTGYLRLDAAGKLQAQEFAPDTRPLQVPSVLADRSLAELERPLSYSRDFNVLALSAVLPIATGSVDKPVQQRSVLLVRPVYDNTTVGISRGSRRLHHRGWIYALVDTERLLDGVEQSALGPLDIRIYDGLSRQSDKTLLFAAGQTHDSAGDGVAGLQSVRPVGLASRAWTQVARLGQGDQLPVVAPVEEGGWLPLWLLLLSASGAWFWSRNRWPRQQSQRENTRAF